MSPLFEQVDSHELRLLLDKFVGGPAQIDVQGTSKTVFLPLAGPSCQIELRFRDGELSAVEPGPGFDKQRWARISGELEKLSTGPVEVGRELAFSSRRVRGHWTGKRSGVQILPPPESFPRADVEYAQHPFILEFPLRTTDFDPITDYRRGREHRRLVRLLNLLLSGYVSFQPQRAEHLWAAIPRESGAPEIKWVQPYYFAKLGDRVIAGLSAQVGEQLKEVAATEYYAQTGHDGDLRVPDDLDLSIDTYLRLDPAARDKFDRGAFWLWMAYRQWSISASLSFTALVSAIEAFTDEGEKHRHTCATCGAECTHEIPGPTKRFTEFLETHAPGDCLKKRRSEMYGLRSAVLHGGKLLQLDHDPPFCLSLDPRYWGDYNLHTDLWDLTKRAMRAWLKNKRA